MNDEDLRQALARIWGPYCESFLDTPTTNRLTIEMSARSVKGRLRLTAEEWSRMDRLAADFQNRFDMAFNILCEHLDPRSRGYAFDFFQGEDMSLGDVSRLRASGILGRRAATLGLVAAAPTTRSAAKLVKRAAPKKVVKAKAATKPATRKPVAKKPQERRK